MARRSSIARLPEDVRQWLDRALAERNFSGYAQLEGLLRERGFELSKSAIHRHGQKVERRMAAIRASTEAAKLITEAAQDDQDARSEALHALVQTELFDTILNLQEAGDADLDPTERVKLLSAAAKNIATLTRASVNLKRFQTEVRARLEAATVDVEKIARQGGMSDASVREMLKVLGTVA